MGTTTIEYFLRGRKKDGFIDDTISKAAGETLAAALHQYTNCGIARVFYTEYTSTPETETLTGEQQSIDVYLLFKGRLANGDIFSLGLPAPKLSNFTLDKRGYHLLPAVGAAIAAHISTATGQVVTFSKGGLMTTPS